MNFINPVKTALVVFLLNALGIIAASGQGKIRGVIKDSETGFFIEYANVVLYSQDSALIGGKVSDEKGYFEFYNVKSGQYFLEIDFMGYHEKRLDGIDISVTNNFFEFAVLLERENKNLDAVEVRAIKSGVTYQIDKKVVYADDFDSAAPDALELLEKLPSVNVDVDGNVMLRGSSNFKVLINNKPSFLDGSEALKQIPSGSIKHIEVITNPSAKYEAGGTSGIINIITKRNINNLSNASVEVKGYTTGSHGLDVNYYHHNTKFSYYFGGRFMDEFIPTKVKKNSKSFIESDTLGLLTHGIYDRRQIQRLFKIGSNYTLNESSSFGIDFIAGNLEYRRKYDYTYESYKNTELLGIREHESTINRDYPFTYMIHADYRKQFESEKHYLTVDGYVVQRTQDVKGLLSMDMPESDGNDNINFREKNDIDISNIMVDYSLPVHDSLSLEAGYMFKSEFDKYTYEVDFSLDSDFRTFLADEVEADYNQKVNAAYALLQGNINKLGYQLNLRAEHTLREITNKTNDSVFSINRLDFFPGLKLSYNLKERMKIISGYSRRISRPSNKLLEPQTIWLDAYNTLKGNPELKPEYSNNFDLAFHMNAKKLDLNIEVYHRYTQDKIERIRSVFSDRILESSYYNIGAEYHTGFEFGAAYLFTPIWKGYLNGSIYNQKLDVEFGDLSLNKQRETYNASFINRLRIGDHMQTYFYVYHYGPGEMAQGKMDSYSYASLAVRAKTMKDRFEITLSFSDLFNSRRTSYTLTGNNFTTKNRIDPHIYKVGLTLRYNLNKSGNEDKNGFSGIMEDIED